MNWMRYRLRCHKGWLRNIRIELKYPFTKAEDYGIII